MGCEGRKREAPSNPSYFDDDRNSLLSRRQRRTSHWRSTKSRSQIFSITSAGAKSAWNREYRRQYLAKLSPGSRAGGPKSTRDSAASEVLSKSNCPSWVSIARSFSRIGRPSLRGCPGQKYKVKNTN